jgi:hypothetical protein
VKKGKIVPLRSIDAHLGDRRCSSYSFLTSALQGGEWSASRPGRALPPGKEPPVPIVQEAGWAPEPVWAQRLEEKTSASVGDRNPAVQSVVRHYTNKESKQFLLEKLIVARAVKKFTAFYRHKRYITAITVVKKDSHWSLIPANLNKCIQHFFKSI